MRKQNEKELEKNIVDKLSWKMAERDEKKVAKEMHEGKEIDEIYGLDEIGLLDGFYQWLEEIGAVELIKKITPEGIQRVLVPFFQFVMLYLLKIIFGVSSMNSLPQLLFSNVAAMVMVGFNAYQVENGVCNRGKSKNGNNGGPICDDALSRNIVKIPLKVIEKFFNGVVRLLAKNGMFPKTISVSIDPTDIQTTSEYEGCGSVTRKKRVKDKTGAVKEIEITVFGWKLMAVFYGRLKIPLAAKLLKIQESENNYTIEMVKMAQKNLGNYSRIKRVVMDRGHLDGKDLWWLAEQGIEYVVPAKANMAVTEDARALAEEEIKNNSSYVQSRTRKVKRGIGKESHWENLTTTVVGIKGLTTYDQYGPEGFDKDADKKSFKPNKINAVVIIEWEGKKYPRDKWTVYLTNMHVYKPLKAFDEYDDRSIIENCLFKEAKTGWHIKNSPQKTEQAMAIHIFFTLAIFALTNAYRAWCKKQEELIDDEFQGLGIERWRQEIKRKGKNKGVVFIGSTYGIFWLAEIMTISGIKVKRMPKQVGTRQEILARYGIA